MKVFKLKNIDKITVSIWILLGVGFVSGVVSFILYLLGKYFVVFVGPPIACLSLYGVVWLIILGAKRGE